MPSEPWCEIRRCLGCSILQTMPNLVLASGSPRRHDLLAGIGLKFLVAAPDVDESIMLGEGPSAYVKRIAELKAATSNGEVVLSADTTVVFQGEVIGKPADEHDARTMLRRLAGETHQVFTAVCVVGPAGRLTEVVRSDVRLASLTDDQIAWYVGTGEPMDKAGSYGLQGIGMAFVEAVSGSVTNVIGLPMAETMALLESQGVEVMRG